MKAELETKINQYHHYGYQLFSIAGFTFSRDAYFAHIKWPSGSHSMPIDHFLRALMRDVAWRYFYGTVNFDHIFGTENYYGEVEVFAGKYNKRYKQAGMDYFKRINVDDLDVVFNNMLEDWVGPDFDPFAAPQETSNAWGSKRLGKNLSISRERVVAKRGLGLKGDAPLRSDQTGHPVNRHFVDVDQTEPVVNIKPEFADEIAAFNLFSYLSRSDVTWNPSVVSVVEDSLFCPTTEEYILPIIHGNDRVEWFIQLSDEITWDIEDKETGDLLAKITMRPGDVAAMPADIRHQGYAPKRSMLLVWENASPEVPKLIANGKLSSVPVEF